jgi:4-hydroxy-3-methylbut-2-enyl diphosphate reductase
MTGRKLTIKIAENAGFCFGVRRAVDLAQKTVKTKKKVYTLGPLIHNPQEVKRLSAQGIKPITLKTAFALKKGIVVLRTHGISLSVREQLKKQKNLSLIDATCPFVKKTQNIVRVLSDSNETIAIVGEKTHPEVTALLSYGGQKCFVLENPKDAKAVKTDELINVVCQTTQTPENFNKTIECLKKNNKVKVFNTICKATLDRQKSAHKLACNTDLAIVVGGKNSANTSRLAQICKALIKTRHIETSGAIKKSWLKEVKKVGITAGASTPDWVINEVKKKIEETANE